MISHVGDPTLNKPSEWMCKVCGHGEEEHYWDLARESTYTLGCHHIACNCNGFEDKE